jgi:hypothetical protein
VRTVTTSLDLLDAIVARRAAMTTTYHFTNVTLAQAALIRLTKLGARTQQTQLLP